MEKTIAVIGLGYLGFLIAVEFAKHDPTVGFERQDPARRGIYERS